MFSFLGFNSIEDLLNYLFLSIYLKLYMYIFYLSTFFIIVDKFIENYVWENTYAYVVLIGIIIVEFLFEILVAIKQRYLKIIKLHRFLIKIVTYTILLAVATHASNVSIIMSFLPFLFYSIFLISIIAGILQSAEQLNLIPKSISSIFNIITTSKIKKIWGEDIVKNIDDTSNKIILNLYDILFKINADKVLYVKFFTDTDKELVADVLEVINENNPTIVHFTKSQYPIKLFAELLTHLGVHNSAIIKNNNQHLIKELNFNNIYVFRIDNKNKAVNSLLLVASNQDNFTIDKNDLNLIESKIEIIQKSEK